MNEQDIKDFKKAGQIAGKARDYGASLIKEGEIVVEILNKVEEKIYELGGEIAFPAQISLNTIAAHSCDTSEDKTLIKSSDVIKLDVGVHINGFIGDTARTINLDNSYKELLKASETALNNALKQVTVGISTGDIGKTIQETITSFGFQPIKNLSGHGLGKYQIHTEPKMPNIFQPFSSKLKENQTIAIEPFATNGAGAIQEGGAPTVFAQIAEKPIRSNITREVFKKIQSYNGLPFTTRWLSKEFGIGKTRFALNDLQKIGIIHGYAPLSEINKGIVSQHEHSMIVTDKGPIITTKLDDD
ncbi:MAG: type II methionyl aminopeptidase [Candidatus Woesearchaeota archaeon]